jgi:hypothetical protein
VGQLELDDQLYDQSCMTCIKPTFCGRNLVNTTQMLCAVKYSRNRTHDVLTGYSRDANNQGYSWVSYPYLEFC